ncbi:MAG: putative lipid II flippase FtsW [Clostridiales bacterium]|jgi:cell division protein FtsW|nr:putative lipid II flippase FtsW [Clostridiales bacterium]
MTSEAVGSQQRPPRVKPAQSVIAVNSMDYTIYLVVVILTLIGVVMVFSANYLTAATSAASNYDTFYLLKRNAVLAVGGFIAMNVIANINYRIIQRLSIVIYMITIGLMALVIVIGISSHGATRWIPLPIPGINQFQPSELAKPALVFMLAFILHRNPDFLKAWPGFLFCVGVVGVMAGMSIGGSFSSAIILAVIGIGMLFIASKHILRFIVLGGLGAGAVTAYLALQDLFGLEDFRGGRFDAWLDPWKDPSGDGFQIIQSWYAIASGGMFGLGIGQSRQKSFLPEPHNDYIFAIICEELGLIGAAIVLLLFGILIWRGIRVAMNATDTFGALAATGITLTIASQVLINVAVVTNTIPATGITLPFISYGGTSLLISMAMMGVLLNISRYSKEQ